MAYNETYRTDPAAAFEGMVADMSNAVIVSKTAEAAIGFGKAVARGDDSNTARVTETGDTEILGIAVRSQATEPTTTGEYPAKDTAAIMRKGPIWVKAGATVAEGDSVYVTVNGGAFTGASGTGKVQIAGATFETAGAANDLVRVHIV